MKSCGLNKIFLKQKLFPYVISDWKVLLGAPKEQVGGVLPFIYLLVVIQGHDHIFVLQPS